MIHFNRFLLFLFFAQFHKLFTNSGRPAVLLNAFRSALQLLHNRFTAAEFDCLDQVLFQFGFLVENAQSSAVAKVVYSLGIVGLITKERQNDQRHSEVKRLGQGVVLEGKNGKPVSLKVFL